MSDKATFTLTIQDCDPGGPPVHRRLARLLKMSLRGFGFRCLRVVEVEPTPPVADPGDARLDEPLVGASTEPPN